MTNRVQSIISFEKNHPIEIKFQYIFSNTLAKISSAKKGRNLKQVTKIFADEVLTNELFCREEDAASANAKQNRERYIKK